MYAITDYCIGGAASQRFWGSSHVGWKQALTTSQVHVQAAYLSLCSQVHPELIFQVLRKAKLG